MEQQLSDILDNLLGLLLLEGSYEIEEDENGINVLIETKDAGRLIGSGGQSLDGLQLIVNQIMSRKTNLPDGLPREAGEYKRVILDVGGWRKQKEEELTASAKSWAKQVLETGKDVELEPMSPWQRRIVHMVVSETEGVESESAGEGRDRHVTIKEKSKKSKAKSLSRAKPRDEEN